MATKYIDHGAYSSAVFTASIATNTLTVTSVTSGIICLGSIVISTNITSVACYISAFVSGTNGGVGIYTLTNGNTIASATCTSYAGNPLNVPLTWALPQEGDGTASTPATASAIASITFSGIPTSGVITVMGASVSTTGVLNAASADAAANALATNINATVNTITVLSTGWFANKLQDTVYARGPSTGAASGTCEIMTRAGSATYNSLSTAGIAYTLNNVSSGASPLLFTGGSGGCWGLLTNSALGGFPSNIAVTTYGCFNTANIRYLAGVIAAGDLVYLRPKDVIITNTSSLTYTLYSGGTSSNFTSYKIDDTTVWSDSDNKVLDIKLNSSTPTTYISSYINLYSSKNTNGTIKFRLCNISVGSTLTFSVLGSTYIEDVCLGGYSPSTNSNYILAISSATSGQYRIKNCLIIKSTSTKFILYNSTGGSASVRANIGTLTLDNTGSSSTCAGVLTNGDSSSNNALSIDNFKCIGFQVGSILNSSPTTATYPFTIDIRNAEIPNITFNSPVISNITASQNYYYSKYLSLVSSSANRDTILDCISGYSDWLSQRNFPKLSATLPDGVTLWSLRFIPTTTAVNISSLSPYTLPDLNVYNNSTDSPRTFTLEYCLETSLFAQASAPHTGSIWIEITYTDTSGNKVLLTSYDNNNVALTTSTTTWSQETAGQVTFDNAGLIYMDKKKFVLTTTTGHDLKANTLVSANIKACYIPTSNTKFGFINPELSII